MIERLLIWAIVATIALWLVSWLLSNFGIVGLAGLLIGAYAWWKSKHRAQDD